MALSFNGNVYSQGNYDFAKANAEGKMLYYTIIDSAQGNVSVKGSVYNYADGSTWYTGNIILPDSVVHNNRKYSVVAIADSAFAGQWFIDSVGIPSSVVSIGEYAFDVVGKAEIVIGTQVTQIGQEAFRGVPNIVYGGTATGAPWGALAMNAYHEDSIYYSDQNKTTVLSARRDIVYPQIAPTARIIGSRSFWNCREMSTLIIPEGVEVIDDEAFALCYGLTSVIVPSTVIRIGKSAFRSIGYMTSYYPEAGSCDFVIHDAACEIDSEAFYNANLSSLDLGDAVTSLGSMCFGGIYTLYSYTFPPSIRHYGDSLFYYCSLTLREVNLPSNIDTIPPGMFAQCQTLGSLTLPASVKYVGKRAFGNCYSLSLTLLSQEPPTVEDETTFEGMLPERPLTVPCGSKQAYEQHPYWSFFHYIEEDCNGIEERQPVAEVAVRAADGEIQVLNAEGSDVRIYNTMGCQVGASGLPAGVYFVSVDGQVRRKVVLMR